MRVGLPGGLLAGLCAGFALGWLLKAPEERGSGEGQAARGSTASVAPDTGGVQRGSASPLPSRSASAGEEGAAASPPEAVPTPRLEGSGGPADWRDPAWVRARLRREYAKLSAGGSLSDPELEHWAAELDERVRSLPFGFAYQAWTREQQRQLAGTLGEQPRIRIQVRTGQRLTVGALPDVRPYQRRGYWSNASLDMRSPPDREENTAHVESGIVPPGHWLRIEAIEVNALWAGGHLEVRGLPGDALRHDAVGKGLRARYEGSLLVRPGREDVVSVEVEGATVEVVLEGVLTATGEPPRDAAFRLKSHEGDGFITGEPITIQVVADHGGGNPRTVYLDGTDNGRFQHTSERDLWDATGPLKELRDSTKHVRGAGVIPPGKVYEVTRVTWRGRYVPRESNRHFTVRLAGETLFEGPTRDRRGEGAEGRSEMPEAVVEGSWSGRVRIPSERRGREQLEVTAHKYGILEVRVEGSLVEAASR